MPNKRYNVNQQDIDTIITWIKSEEIAIPDIQRPFVWSTAKVRDFVDSLYWGYPVGYLIAWKNPDVRLKDGTKSAGKRILIDGQQRVMALLTALLGQQVVTKAYRRRRITIAFNPGEERFEVTNPAISRDRAWIPDISTLFAPDFKILKLLDLYCEANHTVDRNNIYECLERVRGILYNSLGIIDLNETLDVETVAEIFVRINSEGVPLNVADFAMSKMAATERYGGHQLRKCIDYFCHLSISPHAYDELIKDHDFSGDRLFSNLKLA